MRGGAGGVGPTMIWKGQAKVKKKEQKREFVRENRRETTSDRSVSESYCADLYHRRRHHQMSHHFECLVVKSVTVVADLVVNSWLAFSSEFLQREYFFFFSSFVLVLLSRLCVKV